MIIEKLKIPIYAAVVQVFYKFKIPIAAALPASIITDVIDKYIFNDWQFVIFLAIILSIDTILGVFASIKEGTFSSSGFSKFFTKVLIYFCVLILTHVMGSFKIDGEQNHLFNWIDHFTYSAIMIAEAISIFENVKRIRPKMFPSWILDKLKSMQGEAPKIPDQK